MDARILPLAATLLVLACGGEAGSSGEPEPAPGCDELELVREDGSCQRPGVPLDGCGEGFVHDGRHGCEAILPVEPCPPGLMAVPGDTACRPIMECGASRWGEIPVDGATEYVDGSYAGTDSDGTEARPWTTIGQAIIAASPGASIAVAAGTYVEDLSIGTTNRTRSARRSSARRRVPRPRWGASARRPTAAASAVVVKNTAPSSTSIG